MIDFLLGLGLGAVVVALQAVAILAYARRFPEPAWHVVLVAVLLAVPFVAALELLEAADADLGLATAQVALIFLGPELAERTRGPELPSRREVRRTVWLLRAVQLLCVVLAILLLGDLAAAAPAVVTLLALERCRRYVARS